MKVMDGFGRNLTDQYYKVGSSLEIVCEVRDDTINKIRNYLVANRSAIATKLDSLFSRYLN